MTKQMSKMNRLFLALSLVFFASSWGVAQITITDITLSDGSTSIAGENITTGDVVKVFLSDTPAASSYVRLRIKDMKDPFPEVALDPVLAQATVSMTLPDLSSLTNEGFYDDGSVSVIATLYDDLPPPTGSGNQLDQITQSATKVGGSWPVTEVSAAGATSIWVYGDPSGVWPERLAVGSRIVIDATGTIYDGAVSTVLGVETNSFKIETGLESSDIISLSGYWSFADGPSIELRSYWGESVNSSAYLHTAGFISVRLNPPATSDEGVFLIVDFDGWGSGRGLQIASAGQTNFNYWLPDDKAGNADIHTFRVDLTSYPTDAGGGYDHAAFMNNPAASSAVSYNTTTEVNIHPKLELEYTDGSTIDHEDDVAYGSRINISVTPGVADASSGQGVFLVLDFAGGGNGDNGPQIAVNDGQTIFGFDIPHDWPTGVAGITAHFVSSFPVDGNGDYDYGAFFHDPGAYSLTARTYTVTLVVPPTLELVSHRAREDYWPPNVVLGSHIDIRVTPDANSDQGVFIVLEKDGSRWNNGPQIASHDGKNIFGFDIPGDWPLGEANITGYFVSSFPVDGNGDYDSGTFFSDPDPYTLTARTYTVTLVETDDATINLMQGINMVSLPLAPAGTLTAKDFIQHVQHDWNTSGDVATGIAENIVLARAAGSDWDPPIKAAILYGDAAGGNDNGILDGSETPLMSVLSMSVSIKTRTNVDLTSVAADLGTAPSVAAITGILDGESLTQGYHYLYVLTVVVDENDDSVNLGGTAGASDTFSQTKLCLLFTPDLVEYTDVSWLIRYDPIGQEFDPYIWSLDNQLDGFDLQGGQGYIVHVSSGRSVSFNGTAWSGLLNNGVEEFNVIEMDLVVDGSNFPDLSTADLFSTPDGGTETYVSANHTLILLVVDVSSRLSWRAIQSIDASMPLGQLKTELDAIDTTNASRPPQLVVLLVDKNDADNLHGWVNVDINDNGTALVSSSASVAPARLNPQVSSNIWAFVATGQLTEVMVDSQELYTLRATNLSSGKLLAEMQQRGHNFRLPMVDPSRQDIVKEGDLVKLEVIGINGKRIADGQFSVGQQEIASAYRLVEIQYNPIPDLTRLLQNYPNPFNPETWIPFELSQDAEVEITIYDVAGRLVRQIPVGFQPAGVYSSKERAAYWDGKTETGEQVASGIYFYHVRIGQAGEDEGNVSYTQTRRMVILK